jgi:hypothetical protein
MKWAARVSTVWTCCVRAAVALAGTQAEGKVPVASFPAMGLARSCVTGSQTYRTHNRRAVQQRLKNTSVSGVAALQMLCLVIVMGACSCWGGR